MDEAITAQSMTITGADDDEIEAYFAAPNSGGHRGGVVAAHTLNIDFADAAAGPPGRIAVELTASSARELVGAIERALAGVPEDLLT
jgi:hypothetical protein